MLLIYMQAYQVFWPLRESRESRESLFLQVLGKRV